MIKNIWLCYEVFNCIGFDQGGTLLNEEKWKRSYEIWNRASFMVEKNENKFDLIDGIANLKRSLNHRLHLIEELYHFKDIFFISKPKGYLELLQYFELVRPYVMKNLLYIRNDIEHNDAIPPNQTRCKELVDIVWYFLKSTDSYVQIMKESFSLNMLNETGEETRYEFSVNLDYNNHGEIELSGWFPEDMISLNERDDFFLVNANYFQGKEMHEEMHQEKLLTDKWVNGTAHIKNERYRNVLSTLLSLY